MTPDIFILAGGRSSRFGSDKSAARLGDRTVLDRIRDIAKAALPDSRISIVTAASPANGPQLAFPSVADVFPEKGPLGGLHTAILSAETPWFLLLACDLPFVSPPLIRRLASYIGDDLDAVVPIQPEGRAQPLCAFYRGSGCRDVVSKLVDSSGRAPSVQAIFERVRTRAIDVAELADLAGSEHFFLNMNTPGDLERAAKLLDAQIQI